MEVLLILQFVSVTIILQQYSTKGQDITTCVYDPSTCSCVTNKGIIELYRASSATPYNAINTLTDETYYWLPCEDFTFNGFTGGAIQYVEPTSAVFSLGTHSSAFSDVKDGHARFNMNGGTMARSTFVTCICGSGGYVVYRGEDPMLSYNFDFYSDVCCLGIETGLSAGSILIIVFASLLIVYFLVGTVFQTAVRKAQGRERMPNIAFWSLVPGLIKDGVLFTFTCGRRGGYGKV